MVLELFLIPNIWPIFGLRLLYSLYLLYGRLWP